MDLNILIITAPFGNGHKMVATAIRNTFVNKGYNNVYVVDLFMEAHPRITEAVKKIYIRSYDFGKAYSKFYYGSQKLADKKVVELYRSFGSKKLKNIVETFEPDVIINTFPIMSSFKIKNKQGNTIPVFTIVTDYYAHKFWISKEIDKYYIASDELLEELEKMNIPPSKIVVSGIPVREAFEEIENLNKIYEKYNFNIGKIVLINSGAFGVFRYIKKVCIELCKYKNLQVAVVCGNNNTQKEKLESLGLKNLKVFGFVENIHELYKIATCMITKSGGITITEALAVQLPLIITKPIPGQEKENALYFERKGAAIIANNSYQIVNSTIDLLNNPQLLNAMRSNMLKIYNKSSSAKIVDDVLGSINKG